MGHDPKLDGHPGLWPERATTVALRDIALERERQIGFEGWTTEHDDTHVRGELARAAACYAYFAGVGDTVRDVERERSSSEHPQSVVTVVRRGWPWAWSWWKPKDRRHDLVRAGALIVAEIERLDRLEAKTATKM